MNTDSNTTLQPMTTLEICRRAFVLYKEQLTKLIAIIAPLSIVWMILLPISFENRAGIIRAPSDFGSMGVMMLFPMLMIFLSFVTTSAGIVFISDGFVNRPLTISQAYLCLVDVLFPLLGSLIIASLVIAVGLMLWIPGLIAYVWFCLVPPVVMIEGEGGFGSLKRSRTIVKGHFRKAFFVVPLLAIIQIIVVLISLSLPELSGNPTILYPISVFLSVLLPLLIEPLKITTTTLLYFDLRNRKEGYDFQTMAEELAFHHSK